MITLSKTTVKAIAPYNGKNDKKFENVEIVWTNCTKCNMIVKEYESGGKHGNGQGTML